MTHLGRYLYSLRIQRGADNISEYLKERRVELSESYYRDVESGRKLIKFETAKKLAVSLDVDEREFYFHLLHDMLPEDMFKTLVKPVHDTTFVSPAEKIRMLEEKTRMYQEAYREHLLDKSYLPNEEAVDFLLDNPSVLPLVHFIYMRDEVSLEDLKRVHKENKVDLDLKEIIEVFKKQRIAYIEETSSKIRRNNVIFKVPPNGKGRKLKDLFLEIEVGESINDNRRNDIIAGNNTFIHSSINCYDTDRLSPLKSSIEDLVASFEAEETSLEEPSVIPFFVAIITSSRERYA